jgi:hypothetical protein
MSKRQQPVSRMIIIGGLPDPGPCGDSIAEADPYSPCFRPMSQIRALEGENGQRGLLVGGLPDHLPNREPEQVDIYTGLLPSEMNDEQFTVYCAHAGMDPVQARAAIAENMAKPAPWLDAGVKSEQTTAPTPPTEELCN